MSDADETPPGLPQWARPPDPGMEEPSGSHQIASMADVKEFKSRAVAETKKQILSSDVKWFVGSMVAVGVVVAGVIFYFQGLAERRGQEAYEHAHQELEQHKESEATIHGDVQSNIKRIDSNVQRLVDRMLDHKQ